MVKQLNSEIGPIGQVDRVSVERTHVLIRLATYIGPYSVEGWIGIVDIRPSVKTGGRTSSRCSHGDAAAAVGFAAGNGSSAREER